MQKSIDSKNMDCGMWYDLDVGNNNSTDFPFVMIFT